MTATMRTAAAALAALWAGLSPAQAAGKFLCEIDDASMKFSAESAFSHGLGGVFVGFQGAIEIFVKDAPKDLAKLEVGKAHLAHHWFADGDLNLHIYREREGDAPHGYVELIVKTERDAKNDDESAYDGTYELSVYDVGEPSAPEGRTWTATGKASCSAGF
jgi:hypothetical protein